MQLNIYIIIADSYRVSAGGPGTWSIFTLKAMRQDCDCHPLLEWETSVTEGVANIPQVTHSNWERQVLNTSSPGLYCCATLPFCKCLFIQCRVGRSLSNRSHFPNTGVVPAESVLLTRQRSSFAVTPPHLFSPFLCDYYTPGDTGIHLTWNETKYPRKLGLQQDCHCLPASSHLPHDTPCSMQMTSENTFLQISSPTLCCFGSIHISKSMPWIPQQRPVRMSESST